jgi:putative spermidine/putrescine transport system ATP-binding protein
VTKDLLFALHGGLSAPEPGETVRISIAPEAVITLAAEDEAA